MYLFNIPNMTCGGCARSVTKAIQSVDPDAAIEINASVRSVKVETKASAANLQTVLEKAGYPAIAA